MPVFIGGQIRRLDSQQVFHGAGDVVTFDYLRGAGHGTLERLLRGFGVGVQAYGHIGHEARAQLSRVQHSAVAFDDPSALQFLHAAQAGRGRQANGCRKVKIAESPVLAKGVQYTAVYVVNLGHILRNMTYNAAICNQMQGFMDHKLRMDHTLLFALVGFAFATSVTPGPNNMMVLASGANFGFRRSLPHILGISLGHAFMVFIVGLGLAQVFHSHPYAQTGLKIVSVIYMLWLAWKIANAAPPREGEAKGRPFTFLQAAAFQWVNPKAWAMALTAVTVYPASDTAAAMAVVAVVFAATNFPSVSVWALVGQQLRRWLTTNRRLRMFNIGMAVLLVASLWPVLA